MEVKPVIMVLADISGYTRFIKWHRVSLIHAEKIITELLESVVTSTHEPLVLHELEGDAVNFYAVEEDQEAPAKTAQTVFAQVERCIEAFRQREAELISDCSICDCEACSRVGQLKIKVVIHRGEAVFTKLRQFTKVAGEDVIIAHRLLKNTVPSDEYILMTAPFIQADPGLRDRPLERRTEYPEGLGEMEVYVLDYEQAVPVEAADRTLLQRLKTFFRLERYLLRRLFSAPKREFRNLPVSNP